MVSDRDTIFAAYAAAEDAVTELNAFDYSGLSAADQLELLSRRETLLRRFPVADHALLAGLHSQTTPREIGGKNWADVLTIRLHISAQDARRRVRDMADLGPRSTIAGETLAPAREHIAAAQAAGAISAEHIAVMNTYFKNLPGWVDTTTSGQCEQSLVAGARHQTPEELRAAAEALLYLLDQDGPLPDDAERARKRSFRIGKQQPDGMSKVDGWLDPEARATLEAVHDKLGAPGMCNPADPTPCQSGTPTQAQIDNDTRSADQRNHDALAAMGRIALGTDLGDHNGLPVTIAATCTVAELEQRTGHALTLTGSKLPIKDLLQMAATNGADHYLAVFDQHGEQLLYMGRARRTATVAQRFALFARDLGCTKPNCTAPASRCQAHHVDTDWRDDGPTDITNLALACGCDNRLADTGGWHTTMANGRPHWTPPPLLDVGQPRTNNYWHPTLYPTESEDGESDGPTT